MIVDSYTESRWEDWFAWRPVKLNTGEWVWWKGIQRISWETGHDSWAEHAYYEYRRTK